MAWNVVRAADAQIRRFPWGDIRWYYNSQVKPDAELTFGVVEINRGECNTMHSHPNGEELLYVLSGRCVHSVGKEHHEMGPGDLVAIPRGVSHQAEAVGEEPLTAVICYSTPKREVVDE